MHAACAVLCAAGAALVSGEALIYERRVFPQTAPLVCATYISHHRFDLLERAMRANFRHFDEDEPAWLTYEVAWFDNGSGEPAREFAKRVQVEHVQLSEHNLGLPAAINALVRRLCTAPYLMTLEEDWEFGGDVGAPPDWQPSPGAPATKLMDTPARRVAVASAAGLLAADAQAPAGLADPGTGRTMPILGVTLRSESLDAFIRAPRRSEWRTRAVLAPPIAGAGADAWYRTVEYRTYCLDWRSNQVFAAYTNGAALYNRSRLLGLGPMYGDPDGVPNPPGERVFHDAHARVGRAGFPSHYGETNYAVRAGMRYCSATLRLEPGCEGTPDTVGGTCSAAFVHTGAGRGYGLEKKKAAKTPEDADQVWMYYGTPVYDAAVAAARLMAHDSVDQTVQGLQAAIGLASTSGVMAAARAEGVLGAPPAAQSCPAIGDGSDDRSAGEAEDVAVTGTA